MSSKIGEIQETGVHEITIWNQGMEPQWMIDEIIKNEKIVEHLKAGLKPDVFDYSAPEDSVNLIRELSSMLEDEK